MKKGQVYEGIVERVDFPNKGFVRIGEETCIVKNGLPGQKISFRIQKIRKGKAEGQLLEVIEKSPLQTELPCSHFSVCGGCTYLSLKYEEQAKIKETQVYSLLKQALGDYFSDKQWEGIKRSPKIYEYRNKMEFSFGDEFKDGPLALGMHKRASFYDIVTVENCVLVDEDYRMILKTTLEFFKQRKISFYHRMSHVGFLRHLLVRKATKTGDILVALVTTTQYPEQVELLQKFCEMLLKLPVEKGTIKGILHIENDTLADIVACDHMKILYGEDFFYEELLGLRFKISPFSFFQTNSKGAEVLYQTVRDYIGDSGNNQTVFDLYSGTGTIAQLVAPVAKKVIGVEIVEEAVKAAKENAKQNGLHNCEFIAGDVLKVLDTIEDKPDMIILDPPRDGIHPKALPKILQYGVEKIVYISCKPTSLARDLKIFTDGGYQVIKAVSVDQFPWTANVETVCLLSKLYVAKNHVDAKLDMEELDIASAESKATYDEI